MFSGFSTPIHCPYLVTAVKKGMLFLLTTPMADAWVGQSAAFPHDISHSDAARITKLDIEMVHHESWKTIRYDTNTIYLRALKS